MCKKEDRSNIKTHNFRPWLVALWAFTLLTSPALGLTRTWTNSAGDQLWATAANWNGGVPGAGDYANFSTNATGTNIVGSDRAVFGTYYGQTPGEMAFETQIGSGITLTNLQVLYVVHMTVAGSPTCRVDVTGSGTLKVGGLMRVGGRTSGGGYPKATMKLKGVNFVTDSLRLDVGYAEHAGNFADGILDLTEAASIQSGSALNCLMVTNGLWIGYSHAYGLLKLPPTVTNITCGNLNMGATDDSTAIVPYSELNLGTNPALTSLTALSDVTLNKAQITYSDGTTQITGFPPNVAITLGAPGAPINLKLACMYRTDMAVRWGGFRRLEAWLNQLYLGRGSNSRTTYGELDLTNTNTLELAGSFANNMMSVTDVRLGGGDADGTGCLKLPGTTTNMTVGTLHMGYMANLSGGANSVINLGSNSLLRELVISNEFRMGRAQFQYISGSGSTITGMPAGVKVRIGSPTARALLYIGDAKLSGSETRFGRGVTDFTLYATNAIVGRGYGGGHWSIGQLDLSGATNMTFDVQGTFQIAEASQGYGYVNLFGGSVGGRGSASNLYLNPSALAAAAHLVLSNVQFAVLNEVVVKSATSGAKITNYVNQIASGIDLGSTNLVLPDGSMHIVFQSDPPNQILPYWGLRVKGNAIAQISALTTTPAKVTYNISGLSAKYQSKFGVFYDQKTDRTILGIPSVILGTVFVIH